MKLTVDRVIDAPPEAVWDVLLDVPAWPAWGPTINQADLNGPYNIIELGSTGVVHSLLGVALPFVITEFHPVRSWTLTIARVLATSRYLSVCALALQRVEAIVTR